MSQTNLALQDYLFNFDSVTELEDGSVFELKQLEARPWGFDDITLANISVEMNRDLKLLSRDGYTLLDLFSDIGGIQSILFSFAGTIVAILNYN